MDELSVRQLHDHIAHLNSAIWHLGQAQDALDAAWLSLHTHKGLGWQGTAATAARGRSESARVAVFSLNGTCAALSGGARSYRGAVENKAHYIGWLAQW